MMRKMSLLLSVFLLFSFCVYPVDGLASSLGGSVRSVETRALCEWLLNGNRCSLQGVELGTKTDDITLTTTRSVAPGETIVRLQEDALWSAAAAYQDKDLGPRLRDLAQKAGPGFGVVALAGVVAAEKVRRFRSRTAMGLAPESAGIIAGSKWGALARYLWSAQAKEEYHIDQDIAATVHQGIQLLVQLLDTAARRAWSAGDPVSEDTSLTEQWAQRAMLDDGDALSWSRSDLERVAANAFGLVLDCQKSPPPFLLEGVGSLIPDPYCGKDEPDVWPSGEPLALVPLVDDLIVDGTPTNAVFGSPPEKRRGDNDVLWCVATRKLEAGERIVAQKNPWL